MSEEHIEDLPLDGESAEGVVGGTTRAKAPARIPTGTSVPTAPPASPTPAPDTRYAAKAPAAPAPTSGTGG